MFFPSPVADREAIGYARIGRGGTLAFTPIAPPALPDDAAFEVYSPDRWRRLQWLRRLPLSMVYATHSQERAA